MMMDKIACADKKSSTYGAQKAQRNFLRFSRRFRLTSGLFYASAEAANENFLVLCTETALWHNHFQIRGVDYNCPRLPAPGASQTLCCDVWRRFHVRFWECISACKPLIEININCSQYRSWDYHQGHLGAAIATKLPACGLCSCTHKSQNSAHHHKMYTKIWQQNHLCCSQCSATRTRLTFFNLTEQ